MACVHVGPPLGAAPVVHGEPFSAGLCKAPVLGRPSVLAFGDDVLEKRRRTAQVLARQGAAP